MTRANLLFQEVAGQVWVFVRKLCIVINVSVVAPTKAGDTIYCRLFESVNKLVGIKFGTNSWDVL
jgi:hypothetical protein